MAYKGPKSLTTREGVLRLNRDLAGDGYAPTVVGILGYSINGTPSVTGQTIAWDSVNTRWQVRKLRSTELAVALGASGVLFSQAVRVGVSISSATLNTSITGDDYINPVSTLVTAVNNSPVTGGGGSLSIGPSTAPIVIAASTFTPTLPWVALTPVLNGVTFGGTVTTTDSKTANFTYGTGRLTWGVPVFAGFSTATPTVDSTFLTSTLGVIKNESGATVGDVTSTTSIVGATYKLAQNGDGAAYAYYAIPNLAGFSTVTTGWKYWTTPAGSAGAASASASFNMQVYTASGFGTGTALAVNVDFGNGAVIPYFVYRVAGTTFAATSTDWYFQAK